MGCKLYSLIDEQIVSKRPHKHMSVILHNNKMKVCATGHQANNYVQ